MRKLIKSLFLPLAVFAMLGLGALTLSASNITNNEVTEAVFTAENLAQTPYLGDVYYEVSPSVYEIVEDMTAEHCSLDIGANLCFIEVDKVLTQVYGKDSLGIIKPLYEID